MEGTMERIKNIFNYSPFEDVYIPYIVEPIIPVWQRKRYLWEKLSLTPLPFLTRWLIYQTLTKT